MNNECTYMQIKKEFEKTQKQVEKLQKMLMTYERTKIDGPWTSKDGTNAQICIDNIKVQLGILSMIIL